MKPIKTNEHRGSARYLTAREASVYTGLCERSIREATYQRELEHIKVGRRLLISMNALDAFMNRFKVPVADKRAMSRKLSS